MTTFFLLLLLFFVIWPMIKGMLAIMRARRSARRFFDQFRQAAGSPQKEPEQPKPRKKINPEDGEFVAFEDLPPETDSATYTETRTEIRVEQQIVDVEWEDIK